MINCQSQGHYLESKAHHDVSPRQNVHTPCHTNQTQQTEYFYKLFHGQLLRGRLDASLLQV